MVEPLRGWLGDAIDAVSQHHERWDGRGYPYRLTGEEITLAARIIAVADVFDVITAKRSYKEALPPEFARKEIARCAGTQFDPAVVRAFLSISLGRLKWAGGPIAWLAQLPVLASIPMIPATMPSLGAAAAATAVTAASFTAVPASTVQDFKLSIQGPPAAEASEESYLDGADGHAEAGAVEAATPAPRATTTAPSRKATPAAPVPTTSTAPTDEEAPPATPPDDELHDGEGDEVAEVVATVLPEDLEDEPDVAPTVAEPTTELTTETPTTDPAPTSVPDPSVEEELAELDKQVAEELVDNPDQADQILAEAEEQRADILASAEEQGEVAPLGGPTKGRSSRTSQGQGNAPEKPLG